MKIVEERKPIKTPLTGIIIYLNAFEVECLKNYNHTPSSSSTLDRLIFKIKEVEL